MSAYDERESNAIDAFAKVRRIQENLKEAINTAHEMIPHVMSVQDRRLLAKMADAIGDAYDLSHGLRYCLEYELPGSDIVPDAPPE